MVLVYGPHDFSSNPELFIRTGNPRLGIDDAHKNIQRALFKVFTDSNSIYRINKLFGRENEFQKFIHLNFINYGNTQLVYKAKLSDNNHVAVLINQPHTSLGVVKNEFENLESLAKLDDRFVVRPKGFFSAEEFGHELYVTDYVPNALCIAHNNVPDNPHGVFNPNPNYHFEKFPAKLSSIINSSIIALLIHYYDRKNDRGIAQTQVSGNDFIFIKNNRRKNTYNTLYDLKLISARGFVNVSFEKYYYMLMNEFCIGTNRDYVGVLSGKIKINHKSVLPMTKEEILLGISMGVNLRYKR